MIDINFDKSFKNPVVGIDEVGRGAWVGPVVAGACLLDFSKSLPKNLNDSKKLSSKSRFGIYEILKDTAHFGIGKSSNNEIDHYGIQKATFKAMERAFFELRKKIGKGKISTLLIDGNQRPCFKETFDVDIKLIIKGDSLSPSISAASILAKCTRDFLMIEMDKLYSGYGFNSNMGYGTNYHKKKLILLGPTQQHRMTFAPMKYMK